MDPAVRSAVAEEPAVESAAARTARRQLATHIRGPKDDAPRIFGRIRSQTLRLKQDSSAFMSDAAGNEGEGPIVIYRRIDKMCPSVWNGSRGSDAGLTRAAGLVRDQVGPPGSIGRC